MKKRLLVLVVCCAMVTTGCGVTNKNYNDSEVKTEQAGEVVKDIARDNTSTEVDSTFSNTEEYTETTEVEESADITYSGETQNEDGTYTYLGIDKCAFTVSERLQVEDDADSYASYSWIREDGMFTVNTEILYNDFEYEEQILKDVYNGEVLQDEYQTTEDGYKAYVRVVQDDEIIYLSNLVQVGDNVIEIKCSCNSEDGLNLAKEAIASFSYKLD